MRIFCEFLYIYIDEFILCLFYLPFTEINNFHIIAFHIIINSQIMSERKRTEESCKRFHQILTSERQTKRSKKAPIGSGGNNNNGGGNNNNNNGGGNNNNKNGNNDKGGGNKGGKGKGGGDFNKKKGPHKSRRRYS